MSDIVKDLREGARAMLEVDRPQHADLLMSAANEIMKLRNSTLTRAEIAVAFEKLSKAIGELSRFDVAYLYKLQNGVEPPDNHVLNEASDALQKLRDAVA